MSGGWAATISAVAAVAALVFAFLGVWNGSRSLRQGSRSYSAQTFLQIADKWSGIYAQRNKVLAADPTTLEQLEVRYGTNYRTFLASQEWRELREVCNFFEFLGVVLYQQFIPKNDLFVLVTVQDRDGNMSRNLKPYIQYLRKHYRSDIYIFYDYLFEQYTSHAPFVPPLRQRFFDPPLAGQA